MKAFKKWNDLNQFHEVVKNLNYPRINKALSENEYKIPFGLKVKLHGTNAGIRIECDGKVVAQKRSSDLVAPADNAGFRAWVDSHEPYWSNLAKSDRHVIVYGEWAGPGVQKGVAVSETTAKHFYVFAVDEYTPEGEFLNRTYGPDMIAQRLYYAPDGVIVVPWHQHLTINFLEKPEAQKALDSLNAMVEKIGECDPLIEEIFEIQGLGEGVVAYPMLGIMSGNAYFGEEQDYFSWFNFKAKSEHHRVNKTKDAVQHDPEKFASVQIFADAYVTEQRLLQGFTEALQGRRDMRLTPEFIKWVVQDIWKESKTEREASPDLDWKAVSKAISSRAVIWYKSKVQELTDA